MAGAGGGSGSGGGAHLDAARAAGVGLQFAASIVLFLLLGQWLDERLGTGPWLLLGGVMLGAAAGFYSLYRQLTGPSKRETSGGEDAGRGVEAPGRGDEGPPAGGAGGGR